MAEYIEREAAYSIAKKVVHAIANGECRAGVFAHDIMNWIDELPSADVAPVQRWIPVTERLPEHGVHVLAACYIKWLGGGGKYYVCDAFYTGHFTDTCSYSDDIDMEYSEEDDEYYMPEGWWEVIKNWDEYSCVAIGDFVTHWMPLPEPPKEETK